MKAFLFLIFIITSALSYSQNRNVLYGERDLNQNKSAIYLDKEGLVYPNYFISDSSLIQSNASLAIWYSTNENEFLKISKLANCTFQKFTPENCTILNDSLIAAFNYKLNHIKSLSRSFTFLIHGYRKSFTPKNGDTPSPIAFQSFKDSISKFNRTTTHFVEIYWDGMYDCCFSASSRNNKPLFKMFEDAQINAAFAGKTVKKILNKMNQDTITIFTHSLGAKVAAYSLLNIDNQKSLTPSNKCINLCLIVPATSAELFSDNYYKRSSYVDFQKSDNYHLFILYNEKDFALRKKDNHFLLFGPGSYKFGNTSLGCNRKNSALKLQKDFVEKFKNSPLQLFDFTSVDKHHHLETYCASPLFQHFIEEIYHPK